MDVIYLFYYLRVECNLKEDALCVILKKSLLQLLS